jgi:hypothetical protein
MVDPRTTHDHPAAALIDRIVDHARVSIGTQGRPVSDLVTDLMTSLLAVVVLCDETLLQRTRLRKLPINVEPWVFLQRLCCTRSTDEPLPVNVGHFVSFIRNSLAHGNVNLDPGEELIRAHVHGVTFEQPFCPEFQMTPDFYGIEIWEFGRGSKSNERKRGTVLNIPTMWTLIVNLQSLAHDKDNWGPEARQWSDRDWRWPHISTSPPNVPEPETSITEESSGRS